MENYDWRTKEELRKRIEELEMDNLQLQVYVNLRIEELEAEVEDLEITTRCLLRDNKELQAKNQLLRAEAVGFERGFAEDSWDDDPYDANPGRPYPIVWLEEEGY